MWLMAVTATCQLSVLHRSWHNWSIPRHMQLVWRPTGLYINSLQPFWTRTQLNGSWRLLVLASNGCGCDACLTEHAGNAGAANLFLLPRFSAFEMLQEPLLARGCGLQFKREPPASLCDHNASDSHGPCLLK